MSREREWKFKYDKSLSICSLQLENWWHDIKVLSLLPRTRPRSMAINAYLGARYSRSVGDMTNIFVCMENVPIFFYEKFSHINPLGPGQARSTRYQDFSNPNLIAISEDLGSKEIRDEYDSILMEQMQNYTGILEETKEVIGETYEVDDLEDPSLCSRSLDTARYLLPLGLKSSFAILMTARKWAESIALLSASNGVVDNEVGLMLKELLSPSEGVDTKGYIPEAAELIHQVEPDSSRVKSTKEVLKYLKSLIPNQEKLIISESSLEDFNVEVGIPQDEYLISNYESLANPLGSSNEMIYENKDLLKVSEILSKYHDRFHVLGNIGNAKPYLFDGFCDIGALRDMNRHRSMSRFIPLFYDIDMEQELKRENKDCFYLCPYLYIDNATKLRRKYQKFLENTYQRIRNWRKKAKKVLSKTVLNEYTKYLLPLAHATRYRFGADIDALQYLVDLRTRNGGHIAYRELTYSWLAKASTKDPLLQKFLSKTERPDFSSREQFVDRE